MDLNSDTSGEMLPESYGGSEMAVEYIEGMYLANSMVSNSCVTDSNGMPIALVLPDPANLGNDEGISLNNEELDFSKETINMINGNQLVLDGSKSASNTLYTIQLLDSELQASLDEENGKVVDAAISLCEEERSFVKTDAKQPPKIINMGKSIVPQPKPELEAIDTSTRLEEFMDVVTTYKCKFCRFSCPWKSGLMSHIRNCHVDNNKKAAASSIETQSYITKETTRRAASVQELEEHDYSQAPELGDIVKGKSLLPKGLNRDLVIFGKPPPLEKNVFLCGQCNQGFEQLTECKNHILDDHNLRHQLASSKARNVKKSDGASRSRPYTTKLSSSTQPSSNREKKDDNSEDSAVFDESEKSDPQDSQLLDDEGLPEVKKKKGKRDKMSDKPFRCNEKGCGYRFSNQNHLLYHSTCHSYSNKPFLCPECGESSENWRGLSLHLWKEHSVDVDLYACKECGYKTYSTFKLDNHKKIHSEERSFICPSCNKGFKQISQLRNHVVIHTDKKNMTEKRWYSEQTCEICNRTFADSKCLKKHQQAVHSKLKPFVCMYCGHMSARKAMLQLHMRQHTGEKPFVCDHCEYRTGDHNSLRRHRMRHTGTKPYKCPHCPYACIQAISYKTHLKNKHPGLEGLYACSLCSFRSVSKENYFNHMSDHRRGAIPGSTELNVLLDSPPPEEEEDKQLPQMHLPENTLQQLEGILPGNLTAAQLIYSCLNALSQENGAVDLPPGVTTSSTSDGTQTITIQIAPEDLDKEQLLFTLEQDGSTTVLLPNEEEEDNDNMEMEILRPIVTVEEGEADDSIDSNTFPDEECLTTIDKNSTHVIANDEAFCPSSDESSSKVPLLSSSVKCSA